MPSQADRSSRRGWRYAQGHASPMTYWNVQAHQWRHHPVGDQRQLGQVPLRRATSRRQRGRRRALTAARGSPRRACHWATRRPGRRPRTRPARGSHRQAGCRRGHRRGGGRHGDDRVGKRRVGRSGQDRGVVAASTATSNPPAAASAVLATAAAWYGRRPIARVVPPATALSRAVSAFAAARGEPGQSWHDPSHSPSTGSRRA
jgi:hypothetical protein